MFELINFSLNAGLSKKSVALFVYKKEALLSKNEKIANDSAK